MRTTRFIAPVAALTLLAAACGGPGGGGTDVPVLRPGPPGAPARALGEPMRPHLSLPHTEADVRFMQGMIAHHAQALELSALIEGRTTRREIVLLGRRISIAQEDEIALMRRWLEDRAEPGSMSSAHHPMPGMLTEEQMIHLAGTTGAEFDRLFLAAMIQHHEGALRMVAELFADPGSAQEDEVFQFASHVESDQLIEIARMERLLRAFQESDSAPRS